MPHTGVLCCQYFGPNFGTSSIEHLNTYNRSFVHPGKFSFKDFIQQAVYKHHIPSWLSLNPIAGLLPDCREKFLTELHTPEAYQQRW